MQGVVKNSLNYGWCRAWLLVWLTVAFALPGRSLTIQVTNTNNSGVGSLFWAITNANANSGGTIEFNLSGTPPFTITPVNSLPSITVPVVIDGTTQPGFSGKPLIQLDGALTTAQTAGLRFEAGASTLRGLAINRFPIQALQLDSPSNTILGNFIGTDVTGTVAYGNGTNGGTFPGIMVTSTGNHVGGTNAGDGNVISGNNSYGLYLSAVTNNVVQGNVIGLTAAGTSVLSNASYGLVIDGGGGNLIGGLAPQARNLISGNGNGGIILWDGTGSTSNNVIEGNYIGTDVTGNFNLGNEYEGVFVVGAKGNRIGGTNAGAGNLISGNAQNGIFLTSHSLTNVIQGNLIGLSANGASALPNGVDGIFIDGSSSNLIGGVVAAARNVISGNTNDGICIELPTDTGNVMQGNYIGTDITGTAAIANLLEGVRVEGCTNTIGGSAPGAGNVISGNGDCGVWLEGTNGNVAGNWLAGNVIGMDATGTNRLGNTNYGVFLSGAAGNVLGGTVAGARNVISGNNFWGIQLDGPGTSGNLIEGNYIGPDATGLAGPGNTGGGIELANVSSNTIGGSVAGAGNLISANGALATSGTNQGQALGGRGIYLTGAAATTVQGNFVGTKADGTNALGNAEDGLDIDLGGTNNIIGGTAPGAGNRFAYAGCFGGYTNDYPGVHVRTNAWNNLISGNDIFGNATLGIDLGDYGPNPNVDCQSGVATGPAGANNGQNYPVLTNAVSEAGGLLVQGWLDSVPNKTYQVQFFASATASSRYFSGYGQGQVYLGAMNLTLGALCTSNFSLLLPTNVPADWVVSATATGPANNTSEFSADVSIQCLVTLTTQPVSRAAVPGGTAVFSAQAATGTTHTNYQWEFQGNPITGATNATLVLTNLQTANFGAYLVVVDNGLCSVDSSNAVLSPALSPAISTVGWTATNLSFALPTQFGPDYIVEYKTNLANAAWTTLTTLSGDGAALLVTNSMAGAASRFYRVRLQ